MKNNQIEIAGFASAFLGVLTVFAGGAVILDLFGMRTLKGDYVPFVVWANFISGFIYLIASFGFFKMKNWTAILIKLAFFILAVAAIVLIIWIWNGEPYESNTIAVLGFRILVTIGLLWVADFIGGKIPLDVIL